MQKIASEQGSCVDEEYLQQNSSLNIQAQDIATREIRVREQENILLVNQDAWQKKIDQDDIDRETSDTKTNDRIIELEKLLLNARTETGTQTTLAKDHVEENERLRVEYEDSSTQLNASLAQYQAALNDLQSKLFNKEDEIKALHDHRLKNPVVQENICQENICSCCCVKHTPVDNIEQPSIEQPSIENPNIEEMECNIQDEQKCSRGIQDEHVSRREMDLELEEWKQLQRHQEEAFLQRHFTPQQEFEHQQQQEFEHQQEFEQQQEFEHRQQRHPNNTIQDMFLNSVFEEIGF
jgi:hypothetical protein